MESNMEVSKKLKIELPDNCKGGQMYEKDRITIYSNNPNSRCLPKITEISILKTSLYSHIH